MTKYSAIPRRCRHHGYQRHHANTKCFFCWRRFLLSRYYHRKDVSPEEMLLRQIFNEGGRYFVTRSRKKRKDVSPKYKGKRPIPSLRRPRLVINPPTGLGQSSLIASWTDGAGF